MNIEHWKSNSPEASKHLSASGRSNTVFCHYRFICLLLIVGAVFNRDLLGPTYTYKWSFILVLYYSRIIGWHLTPDTWTLKRFSEIPDISPFALCLLIFEFWTLCALRSALCALRPAQSFRNPKSQIPNHLITLNLCVCRNFCHSALIMMATASSLRRNEPSDSNRQDSINLELSDSKPKLFMINFPTVK